MNMLVSGVALLLACAAFFTYDLLTFRAARVRGLNVQAQIIGANSVAAIEFNDPIPRKIPSPRFEQPAISLTRAYISTNTSPSPHTGEISPAPRRCSSLSLRAKKMCLSSAMISQRVAKTIIFQEKKVGTVYLISDLSAIDERLRRYAIIVIIVLLTSCLRLC